MEKELQEAKEKLEEKEAKLKAFVAVDDEKIQATYYQDRIDYIILVKPKV